MVTFGFWWGLFVGVGGYWVVTHVHQTVAAVKDAVAHLKELKDHLKSQSTKQ